MRGVRDPRYTQPSLAGVEDPRPDANRDIIALDRRWFMTPQDQRRGKSSPSKTYRNYLQGLPRATTGTDGPAPAQQSATVPPPSREALADEARADRDADLTLLQYRYTRAPEVVNDEMGYGERVTETFWQPTAGGKLTQVERVSQRTKSGRQVLD